ncbi:ribbon-helix-helix domain-containing protein [Candidatus Albibeggiatoa sp. nov. BB20]|uniref:ribbon-helix-helix domain-containing protein n=1 Tax=Candidatus Albibeggiatoa sp. nov. BB20 TaxID=3162723 RepID=UPI0033653865
MSKYYQCSVRLSEPMASFAKQFAQFGFKSQSQLFETLLVLGIQQDQTIHTPNDKTQLRINVRITEELEDELQNYRRRGFNSKSQYVRHLINTGQQQLKPEH